MKPLPIGISDFIKIRTGQYYYVDKSWLIHDLLEQKAEVTLFTRPRRFGKTLNMNMLKEFFDITKDSSALFHGLKVEKSPYYKDLNQYPTLFFSFRESKSSREFMLADMMDNILLEYQKYHFIKDTLSEDDKFNYDKMKTILLQHDFVALITVAKSIQFLTKIVNQYYQKPVVVIIDEYDTPMENAYVEGFYEEVRGFFRMLYASVLKDNPYLKMGILTGIQRVAKESIFSGLNNLELNTVYGPSYGEYFGLTQEETEQLLHDYDLELTDDVTAMYNGYHICDTAIYNPWSMINYVKTKELRPFWVHTSSNTMIKNFILQSDESFKMGFETLITEGTALVSMDLYTSYSEEPTTSTLWGLLMNAGYVTLASSDKLFLLNSATQIRIPNIEVKSEFKHIVEAYTGLGNSNLSLMFHALILNHDWKLFISTYKSMVLRMTSYYDAKENAYHMLFLGMCCYLDPYYEVKSNIEAGHGRSDIILRAKRSGLKHFVIEFKEGEDVVTLAQKAIEQILDRDYAVDLEGDVMLMGVAHNKKRCEIVMREC